MAAKKTVLSIAIDRELLSKIKQLSTEKAYSVSKLISKLLEEALYLEENVFKDEIYKNIDWLSEEWKEKLQILFTKVLDTTPDPIWIKDLNLKIIYVNQAFADLFGIKKEEIIGKSDIEVLPPEVAKECIYSDMKALESKTSSHSIETVKSKDGREIIFDVIKTPIYDKNEKIIAILGISRDITEFIKVQEELKKKNEELEEAYRKLKEIYEFDVITGLMKKRRFLEEVKKSLSELENDSYTLISIEITNLSYANELYGYEFGSKLLKEFSKMLRERLDELGVNYLFGKIGGSRFGLLIKDNAVNRTLLKKFLNFIKSVRITTPDDEGFFVPKIFFVVRKISKKDTEEIEKILMQMEDMISHLKDTGKRSFIILKDQPSIYRKAVEIEKKIKDEIKKGKFHPMLRPVKDVDMSSVEGYMVVCGFGKLAEKYVCSSLDNLYLENIFRIVDQKVVEFIKKRIYQKTDKTIFAKLRQSTLDKIANLPDDQLSKDVMYIKDKTVFMISENTYINNFSNILELKDSYNLKFGIDSFGTGNLPIKSLVRMIEHELFSYLRVGGFFIRTSMHSPKRERVLRGIVTIGKEFGIKTIAADVDRKDIYEFVKEVGFDYVEGEYVGSLIEPEELSDVN